MCWCPRSGTARSKGPEAAQGRSGLVATGGSGGVASQSARGTEARAKLWAPATHTSSLDLDSPLVERLEHPRVTTGGPSYRTRVSTVAWGMGLKKRRGRWRGPSITAVSKEPLSGA